MPSTALPPFPFARTGAQVPQLYSELRACAPVVPVRTAWGDAAWLITEPELARSALIDPRLTSDLTITTEFGPDHTSISQDGAGHTRLRRAVAPLFARPAVARSRPTTTLWARQVLGELRERRSEVVDLVAELALPFVAASLFGHLGLDRAAADHLRLAADRALLQTELTDNGAWANLLAAVSDIVAAGGSRSLARLSSTEGPGLSTAEVNSLVLNVVLGGYPSTALAIAHGLISTSSKDGVVHPPTGDPSTDRHVDHLLRGQANVGSITRRAAEPLEVAGCEVSAGDFVIVSITCVAHGGDTAPSGMVFGHGVHRCLGIHLARQQIAVILEELAGSRVTLADGAVWGVTTFGDEGPLRLPALLAPAGTMSGPTAIFRLAGAPR